MKKFLLAGAVASVFATSALADTIRVKAPVIDSQPNYVTKNIRTPQTSCSVVDVPIYGRTGGGASAGDVLGGMIIGGLLGKGVSGNDKGAAAGAVIGGMISADKNQGDQQIVGYRQEERCKTTYVNERVEQVNGYTVSYELNGKTYTTQSNRDLRPGTMLDISLKITSVYAR